MRFNCDVDCIDFIFRAFAVYFARLNAAELRIRGHLAPAIRIGFNVVHFATDFNPVNNDLPKGCATSFAGHIADAVKEKVHHSCDFLSRKYNATFGRAIHRCLTGVILDCELLVPERIADDVLIFGFANRCGDGLRKINKIFTVSDIHEDGSAPFGISAGFCREQASGIGNGHFRGIDLHHGDSVFTHFRTGKGEH